MHSPNQQSNHLTFYFSFRNPYAWLAFYRLSKIASNLPVTIEGVRQRFLHFWATRIWHLCPQVIKQLWWKFFHIQIVPTKAIDMSRQIWTQCCYLRGFQ